MGNQSLSQMHFLLSSHTSNYVYHKPNSAIWYNGMSQQKFAYTSHFTPKG